MQTQTRIDQLQRTPGKAEIINGTVVLMSPTGGGPGFAGDAIFVSLWQYARRTGVGRAGVGRAGVGRAGVGRAGVGRAMGDNKGFRVDLPHRGSFSPDTAFYVGPDPGMKFYEGAAVFAVEVRSEGDYGAAAEDAIARKRADYFAAGTLVVWDVDLLSEDTVCVYCPKQPDNPEIFTRSQIAATEPAVPDWTLKVEDLF